MPIVRMNTDDADALVEAYDRAATDIGNAIPSLSGLISQAYDLLNMPGQTASTGHSPPSTPQNSNSPKTAATLPGVSIG